MTENTYLVHHGVKGMKWGVRRTPEQLGYSSKSAAKDKYRTDLSAAKEARAARGRKNRGNTRAAFTKADRAYSKKVSPQDEAIARRHAEIVNTWGPWMGEVNRRINGKELARVEDARAERAGSKMIATGRYLKKGLESQQQYQADKRAAKQTYKENRKADAAAAKARDEANYSDYKKAAQSYKKHAAMGEKVVANAMGKPTAYYARRAQGMSRGQATVDVFMKGNMGALKDYGVKLNIRRVYAI